MLPTRHDRRLKCKPGGPYGTLGGPFINPNRVDHDSN